MPCYKTTHDYCVPQIAADGTQCGKGNMWCIDGQCVSKSSGETTPKPTTTTVNGKKTPTRKPTTTTVNGKKTPTRKPSTTTVNGKKAPTRKPTTTTVNGKKTPTPKSKNRSSTSAPSTNTPSCKDSKECKLLYLVYKHKKKFCSEMGEICCQMCKGERKFEDIGYMDLSCADLRSFYSKMSKFCSKWSLICCASCSRTVNG